MVEGPGGRPVAIVADKRAFEEDCRRATLIITALRAPADCRAPLVIDRAFLDRNGATSIRFEPAGPVIATARRPRAARAWMARRAREETAGGSLPRAGSPRAGELETPSPSFEPVPEPDADAPQ